MEREQLNYYLQMADLEDLLVLCRQIEAEAHVELIQKPTLQTLLVPVRDPINHGTFISGEVLVTSAIVLVNETKGWAMVMDKDGDLAVSVAILDGAFAADIRRPEIMQLATLGKQQADQEDARLNARINATRVKFDLL